MVLDVDFLRAFFEKHTTDDNKKEMGEHEAAASTPPSSGGGGSIPKWAETYTLTRGKANKLGASGEKWETGLTRGAANKIW
jgi:hypothetical protein